MDKYHIEKKDREVIEKFRGAFHEQELLKRSRIRIYRKLAILIAACCLVLGVLFIIPARNRIHQTAVKAEKTAAAESRTVNKSIAIFPDPQSARQSVAPMNSQEQVALSAPSPAVADRGLAASKALRKISVNEKSGITDAADKKIRPKFSKPKPEPGLTRISELLTCRAVENRRHTPSQKVFPLRRNSKVFVWMDVRSKKVPSTIMLVFYHNSKRYCQIPLRIRYPQMRTWGYITLRGHKSLGRWRADVVSAGQRLSQIEFSVVP